MKGSVIALVTGFCFCLTLSAWAQEEFPLLWQDVSREELVSGSSPASSAVRVAVSKSGMPPSVRTLPAGVGANASFYGVTLDRKEFVLLIDNTSPAKLYADTDGDGNLAEETPFPLPAGASTQPGQARDEGAWVLGPIDFKAGRQTPDQTIKAYVWVRPSAAAKTVFLCPARYRSGKVRLGDQARVVALVDGNYNGVYNEAFSVASLSSPGTSSDLLAVDLNGDGRFTMSLSPPVFEVLPLPKILPADGGYYSIEAPADGSTLRMQRVEPKMGTFAPSGAEADLLLLSESGYYALNTTATPWTLPVGKYALLQALLKKTDANGAVWSFPVSVLQTSGRAPEIAVAEGRTTTLDLPAPTRARVKVEAMAGLVYFEFTIEAQKGLSYSPAIQKEGKELSPPKFEVTDGAGKVVLSGAFQYG